MLTITQMARANKAIGQFWFDKDSMAFFNTKIVGSPDAFNMFVTSERNPEGKTAYNLRLFAYHSSKVITVGDFHKMTRAEALKLKANICAALRSMGNREQEIFDSVVTVTISDLGTDCYEFSNGEKSFVVRNGNIVN